MKIRYLIKSGTVNGHRHVRPLQAEPGKVVKIDGELYMGISHGRRL